MRDLFLSVTGEHLSGEHLCGHGAVICLTVEWCPDLRLSTALRQSGVKVQEAEAGPASFTPSQSELGRKGPGTQLEAVHAHGYLIYTAPDLHSACSGPWDALLLSGWR